MRDRLIELMNNAEFAYLEFSKIQPYEKSLTEFTANYLIENGVIVPSCKVGDKVYFNHAELNETCPAKVIKITNNYYTPSMPLWITIEYESKLIGRQEIEIASDVFELLFFPTKKEAEKALKGGEE